MQASKLTIRLAFLRTTSSCHPSMGGRTMTLTPTTRSQQRARTTTKIPATRRQWRTLGPETYMQLGAARECICTTLCLTEFVCSCQQLMHEVQQVSPGHQASASCGPSM